MELLLERDAVRRARHEYDRLTSLAATASAFAGKGEVLEDHAAALREQGQIGEPERQVQTIEF